MMQFEYRVVPAPAKGTKAKGVRTPQGRFANSIELLLNDMAGDGWEFQRAELLPSEERSGLTGSATNWRNLLVFRRALVVAETEAAVEPSPAPSIGAAPPDAQPFAQPAPQPEPQLDAPALTAIAGDPEAAVEATPVPGPGARDMIADDGVEELSPVSGITAALKARAKQQHD